MSTLTEIEQRTNERTNLNWPVSMWLPDVNKFFNCRTINVSKGGAYFRVPMTMPVDQGSLLEINFPRTEALAKEKGQFARIKLGRVVRVERNNLLTDADLCVAVNFE